MRRATLFPSAGAGLLALALLLPGPAVAAWPADPAANVPVCTAAGEQSLPAVVADGGALDAAGSGVIVAWQDKRNFNYDIFARRISADGAVQWAANGVALCTAAADQTHPAIVADGAGGAIVVWQDLRSGASDLYAQRISSLGTVGWAANGLILCGAAGSQWDPAAVSDGAGGAVVVWQDLRNGSEDIYAQRISASGTAQWTADGVAVCTAAASQASLTVASDGAGGAIVAWMDQRSGSDDIYAQRISAGGAVQWAADGVLLCSATGMHPALATDAAGDAVVAWYDQRGADYDIYAQRISAGGAIQWAANGVALCTATGNQYYPAIVGAGTPGESGAAVVVTWFDARNGDYDVYAQRISAAGTPQWAADGVAVCGAAGTQWYPGIVADGARGVIVTWYDQRGGGADDFYAQRIAANGAAQWATDGVALCSAAGTQGSLALTSDGACGAIAAWQDYRSGAGYDVYAQRVQSNGQLGGTVDVPGEGALAFALEPVRPNPSRGGTLTVRFTLAGATAASLELLDVAGRRIAAREVGSLGAGRHTLDLGAGPRLAPGLYLVRLRQGAATRVARVAVLR